jgi:ABC-type methionine transport system ATPase subunit
MDILELQYEILSRLSSQCDRLNLTDFQLETGESATDIEAAARALGTHEPHFVRILCDDIVCITDAGRLELARLKQEREQKANEAQAVANQIAELRRIADAASERAEIARQQAVTAQEQARKAEKDATFSKIVAIVSLAASIIIPLVT